jgi:hypothetical protein
MQDRTTAPASFDFQKLTFQQRVDGFSTRAFASCCDSPRGAQLPITVTLGFFYLAYRAFVAIRWRSRLLGKGRAGAMIMIMTGTELARLPLAERIKCYRELAQDSRRLAQAATAPERQGLLLALANQWERLAIDVEQRIAQRNSSPV